MVRHRRQFSKYSTNSAQICDAKGDQFGTDIEPALDNPKAHEATCVWHADILPIEEVP
jgi:hypothetical protein